MARQDAYVSLCGTYVISLFFTRVIITPIALDIFFDAILRLDLLEFRYTETAVKILWHRMGTPPVYTFCLSSEHIYQIDVPFSYR